MKTFHKYVVCAGLIIILFSIPVISLSQNAFITVSGRLEDLKTGDRISYASVTVPGTGIGTVSNSDGEFILKVDTALHAKTFEVSHLGYATASFNIRETSGKGNVFSLEILPIELKEVPVTPKDAREIVQKAFKNISQNYSEDPELMQGFYRESIMQRHDYISISEAVVDIYKSSYTSWAGDQVKIYKGRKGSDVKKVDTLVVKLQGGPKVLLQLDIVKNPGLNISLDNLDNYRYSFSSPVNIDDHPNWVIYFSPYLVYDLPLYFGKLYISQDNYAITRAEFSLDLSDPNKASNFFVVKKPTGLLFMPMSTSYLVTYKEHNGKYSLNYVRVDLKFRCDWKRKLFKNNYTLVSEMAITGRESGPAERFPNQEVFKSRMAIAEKVEDFSDVDFWGPNNIIEPEKSIENAIRKISKKMVK